MTTQPLLTPARPALRRQNTLNGTYIRTEMRRLFRNRQSFAFSLVVPLVIFFAIGGAAAKTRISGVPGDITYGRFYLAGMTAFSTISAMLAGGARISVERQVGWNRQLRLTPLPSGTYLVTKVLTSYLLAVIGVVVLTVAALAVGVPLNARDWFVGFGLALVALIPFAGLGVMIGHLIKGDAMGPVVGLGVSFFAILGGAYFPIGTSPGAVHDLVRLIPSFWLTQASKTGIGGQTWTLEAWLVIIVWSLVFGTGAAWAYRRDTSRG